MEVLDALVVTLGLDASKLNQQQREALDAFRKTRDEAKKTGDDIEKHAKATGEFFGELSRKVLELAAAYIGFEAIKSGIEGATSSLIDFKRATQLAGLTGADAEYVEMFSMAVARMGGDAKQATSEITGLIAATKKMQQGEGYSQEFMHGLIRIGAKPLTDTPQEILSKFADYAQQHRNDPALVTMVGREIGLGDTTIQEEMRGSKQIQADMERSRQLGISTKEQVDAASRLNEKFGELTQSLDTFWKNVLVLYAPAMENFMNPIIGFLSNFKSAPGHYQDKPGFEERQRLMDEKKARTAKDWENFKGWFSPSSWFSSSSSSTNTTALENLFGKLEGGTDDFVHPDSGAPGTADWRLGRTIEMSPLGRALKFEHSDNALPREPLGAPDPRFKDNSVDSLLRPWRSIVDFFSPSTSLESLFYKLEGGGDNAGPNAAGAIGRYQIKLATAQLYDKSATEAKLEDPIYNRAMFDKIIADYMNRYKGDLDAVALAYHNGPSAADAFLARRGSQTNDYAGFGPQTLDYIRRLHEYTPSSLVSGAGSPNMVPIASVHVEVHVPPGADGRTVAKDMLDELHSRGFSTPSDSGLQ